MSKQTNPQTGSDVEIEDDGDFTVTFPMRLPTRKPDADED
jgi:hypothetical protein